MWDFPEPGFEPVSLHWQAVEQSSSISTLLAFAAGWSFTGVGWGEMRGMPVLLKQETDRAGLRLRPGCQHQATHMVTLPVDSELGARCL